MLGLTRTGQRVNIIDKASPTSISAVWDVKRSADAPRWDAPGLPPERLRCPVRNSTGLGTTQAVRDWGWAVLILPRRPSCRRVFSRQGPGETPTSWARSVAWCLTGAPRSDRHATTRLGLDTSAIRWARGPCPWRGARREHLVIVLGPRSVARVGGCAMA